MSTALFPRAYAIPNFSKFKDCLFPIFSSQSSSPLVMQLFCACPPRVPPASATRYTQDIKTAPLSAGPFDADVHHPALYSSLDHRRHR
ncbi:hypothetical protein CDAR_194981 [Caerostris darwini]|uniref:Uncharacterized protein n=1 Tax=Caerostris darwini TaxID=1538125 RepID=A0AAV4X7M0_9ARAC|nr:hypothetical protein CDAR_194981 [Caerostris darwini]